MEKEKRLNALNMLLIDDDELIRKSMQFYFKRKTSSFLAVENAEQALEYLEKGPWDVVICDFKLPGMNGMEFFKTLSGKGGVIKILITGYAVPEMGRRVNESGIHDMILKPFTMNEITTSMTRHLKGRKRKRITV